jgi:myo-inositol catabolism protein IolC
VPGYQGFAIGRSIWWNPLKAYVDGELPRDEASTQIANNYQRFVAVYEGG